MWLIVVVVFSYYIAIGEGDQPTSLTDGFLKIPDEDYNVTTVYVSMPPGTRFFATVRAFTTSGLYATVTSEEVVVSPNPTITVIDSYTEQDAR